MPQTRISDVVVEAVNAFVMHTIQEDDAVLAALVAKHDVPKEVDAQYIHVLGQAINAAFVLGYETARNPDWLLLNYGGEEE